MKYKAVFLDKDGTLLPNLPYNADTPGTELIEGVIEGLQRLQSYGYLLVVVSNQSGSANGYSTNGQGGKAKDALFAMCAKVGIYLDGFYDDSHDNLVPQLIQNACADLEIDPEYSWMVGDILNDIEAGNRAGCKSILVNNGNETAWIPGEYRLPEYFAGDMAEASKYIVAADNIKAPPHETSTQKISSLSFLSVPQTKVF